MIIVKRLNDSRQEFFHIAFFTSVLFMVFTPLFNYLSSHKYSVAKNLITV